LTLPSESTETMHLNKLAFLTTVLAACSSNPPAKAPGTDPEDMSAEEHEAEAEKHDEEADEHKAMDDGKSGGAGKAEHLDEAQEHRDVADQHHDAAEEAEKK
jgi:hypothetical protein